MKVLMVQPGEIPHETDIEPGLESLQAAVDGPNQSGRLACKKEVTRNA